MPTYIAPVAVGGFGSIAATTSSVAASSCTPGPGSNSYPGQLPSGLVTIWNSIESAGNVYVAPLGGTATSACIPLAPGQFQSFTTGAVPSLIAASTATVLVIW